MIWPVPASWAVAMGMPEPFAWENYREYWARMGFPPTVVNRCLTERDPHLAAHRVVAERAPESFARFKRNMHRQDAQPDAGSVTENEPSRLTTSRERIVKVTEW